MASQDFKEMGSKVALVTGATGQVASYLIEHLLSLDYYVHGIVRRSSSMNRTRIDHLRKDENDPSCRLFLHYGDLCDAAGLAEIVHRCRPDEVYNLGAQSHVQVSFHSPHYTAESTGVGALNLLEAVRTFERHYAAHPVRFYQASSSEMFGNETPPQDESTPLNPVSPYGAAKAFAHFTAQNYRAAYRMHVSCGIMFNCESPRRGEAFVTRKITKAVARIAAGDTKPLRLGNLDVCRDWGFAGDYVQAMHLVNNLPKPGDFCICTGKRYWLEDFLNMAFKLVGKNWRDHVIIGDGEYIRPVELSRLLGKFDKLHRQTGWMPTVDFESLVAMMVEHDIREFHDKSS